ncbi:hypothetical protein [Streptomyces sp. NBC_00425]|uniref:hypothetical protein n=1 Tax=Streptomyces sp. NBC_00425 TaxID=2975740 RepID=UPI002E23E213
MHDLTPFTADIEALANLLAEEYEEGCLPLVDLHPQMAGRYRAIAADLVSRNLPRDLFQLAPALAVLVDGVAPEDNDPWAFGRHLDAAEDVLNQF